MYVLKDSCAGCPAVLEIFTQWEEIQRDMVCVARLRKVSTGMGSEPCFITKMGKCDRLFHV